MADCYTPDYKKYPHRDRKNDSHDLHSRKRNRSYSRSPDQKRNRSYSRSRSPDQKRNRNRSRSPYTRSSVNRKRTDTLGEFIKETLNIPGTLKIMVENSNRFQVLDENPCKTNLKKALSYVWDNKGQIYIFIKKEKGSDYEEGMLPIAEFFIYSIKQNQVSKVHHKIAQDRIAKDPLWAPEYKNFDIIFR
jgi:hypothetical protein